MDGRLEAEATHLVRTSYWGADDDGTWYPVTREIAQAAVFGRSQPRREMSREYLEWLREYERTYTIDNYPELEG